MKVRKLAVALALAGGLGSGMANALGLGEIELQSWLNEPLDAEITLRQSQGVNPADVYVNVAPEEAYERVGLDRDAFLSKLKFNVVTGPDGGLRIDVTSREPLREPYLNFLLELTWPNGRLMREYAVLVDPPVYAEESGMEESVAAPTASAREPEPRRSEESRRRQAEAESSLSRGYGDGEADSYGPTRASDTLWSIAREMRPDSSVSMHQMMLAIQDENPNAFMGGNINRLMQGQVLRAPSEEQIRSRSRAEADRLVARQNQEFRAPAQEATPESAPEGETQQAAGGAGETAIQDSELKLLVAEETETEARDTEDGASAGGDGEQAGGQDAGAAVAAEEMDALRRENQELDSRLQDLQEQVQTLQRLLELKDNQLADLQGMTAEEAEQADQAAAPSGATEEDTSGQAGVSGDDSEQPSADQPTAGEDESSEAEGQPTQSGDESAAQQADDQETFADESDAAAEPQAQEQQAAPETAPEPAQPAAPAQKPFPGNIIDAIMTNPMYQMALGGGLVLLLLVLLLLRRRQAAKEKEFFEQFADEEAQDTGEGNIDLESGQEAAPAVAEEQPDAMAEADKYLGFGQYPQAAQVLENAISREPSRSDLRLKLLGVYADSQDAESFDKQYNELAALEDEEATARADELRNRMEEDEAGPSIGDLESQLRSENVFEGEEEQAPEPSLENESAESFEKDLEERTDASEESMEFDLSLDELEDETSKEEAEDSDLEEPDFGSLDFDLSDEESSEKPNEGTEATVTQVADDNALEFEQSSEFELDESPELQDLASEFEETESEKPEAAEGDSLEDELSVGPQTLDDSFLDELDAEIDKVSGEDDQPSGAEEVSGLTPEQDQHEEPEQAVESLEDEFDSLDMDLSEEDLAIMDELSDEDDIPSLDEVVAASDEGSGQAEAEPGETEESDNGDQESPESPVEAGSESGEGEPASPLDLDESDLGDDDDFDFLAGTDEAATKLDLARAYVEMGDSEGARDILEEVALEGNDEQKAEAQELLKNLS